jgi:hypothetical protein
MSLFSLIMHYVYLKNKQGRLLSITLDHYQLLSITIYC